VTLTKTILFIYRIYFFWWSCTFLKILSFWYRPEQIFCHPATVINLYGFFQIGCARTCILIFALIHCDLTCPCKVDIYFGNDDFLPFNKLFLSGRYQNDNIFKNVHDHQKKSHWKDVLNICSYIYACGFLM
jgi:hypothetical protein